jgi:Predicted membrane protein
MPLFLIFAYLFFLGSVAGWVLEVFFRRFFSRANPERRWINPGFCTGPWLPLYGSGLCILYLLSFLESADLIRNPVWNRIALFAVMALAMTGIEYAAGLLALRVAKVRLWDYTDQWGNIQGIICPKFSLAWALLGALYYFLIHPRILHALDWLSQNLAFSFFIGLFFGFFILDVVNSANLTAKLRRFAAENDVVVRFEAVKESIRKRKEAARQKYRFLRPLHTDVPLPEILRELLVTFEARTPRFRK